MEHKPRIRVSLSASVFAVVLAAGLAAPPVVLAQMAGNAAPASDPVNVRVTPFVAAASDMAPRVGASLSFGVRKNLSIETELGHRPSVWSSNVSLVGNLPGAWRLFPYVAAGGGLQHARFTQQGPVWLAPAVLQDLAFVVNLGGGVDIPIDRRFGYRVDVRWFNPVGGEQREGWRIYQGITIGLRR
jgi:hypothetical protein